MHYSRCAFSTANSLLNGCLRLLNGCLRLLNGCLCLLTDDALQQNDEQERRMQRISNAYDSPDLALSGGGGSQQQSPGASRSRGRELKRLGFGGAASPQNMSGHGGGGALTVLDSSRSHQKHPPPPQQQSRAQEARPNGPYRAKSRAERKARDLQVKNT